MELEEHSDKKGEIMRALDEAIDFDLQGRAVILSTSIQDTLMERRSIDQMNNFQTRRLTQKKR